MRPVIRVALVTVCLAAAGAAAGPPPADLAGDPSPTGATARLGTLRFRRSTGDFVLAYFPDGRRLATAGHQVSIWEVPGGRLVRTLPTPNATVYAVAVSPDGRTLATCGTDRHSRTETVVRLWDADTGGEVRQLAVHADSVFALAFAPDSKALASAGKDGAVRVWEVATGRGVRELAAGGAVHAVAYSPDGRWLAAARQDGTARAWEVATGRLTCDAPGAEGYLPGSVALSPDGGLLAYPGADGVVRLARPATGEAVGRVEGGPGGHAAVAFAPDGKTLAVSGAVTRLYDVATRREVRELPGPPVTALAFAPDGKTLAGAGMGEAVRLWEVATGRPVAQPDGRTGGVAAVAFAADGRAVASAGADGTVRRWDVGTGRQLARFDTGGDRYQSYASTPDARLVATAGPQVWEVLSGRRRPGFAAAERGAAPVAFSAEGRWLAEGGVGEWLGRRAAPTRVWDVTTAAEVGRPAETPAKSATAVAVSPGGELLAEAVEWGSIRLAGHVTLWDRAGRALHRPGAGPVSYAAVAFSPDGKTLATAAGHAWAGRGGVALWDVSNGQLVRRFGGDAPSACLAFSPDGRLLVVGRGAEVEVWDVATGWEAGRLRGHEGRVTAVAVSADGSAVASGGTDTTVLVWPLARPTRP